MANLRDKNGRSLYFSNRPEYYRRKNISKGVKESWKRRKIIKAQFKKKERIRKQVTLYTKYFISIRALTLNINISESQLRQALDEFINSNEEFQNLFVDNETTIGYEEEEIDSTEEKNLNQNSIYLQTEIRGSTQITKWS